MRLASTSAVWTSAWKLRSGMENESCCSAIAAQIGQVCPLHPDLADCPDAIVVQSDNGQYRFPIRDGGSSYIAATFCPWCGTRLVPATNPKNKRQWAAQADVLARIGEVVFHQNVSVEIELPQDLASLAIQAWDADDAGDGIADFETAAETTERHRAGSAALIGLSVSEEAKPTDTGVWVMLDPMLIGDAISAADDAGLIVGPPRKRSD